MAGGVRAMGCSTGLQLDPSLASMQEGTLIDVVIKLDIALPGCVVGKTMINQQLVYTDCTISGTKQVITLFRVQKKTISNQIWVMQTDQTEIIEHQVVSKNHLTSIVETCAGIGAVDVGYQAAGARIAAANECNVKFAQLLHAKGVNVVMGDNCVPSSISRLGKFCPCSVSGGVSCQPFSKLGDCREGDDVRSDSLVGALRMIYLLQSPFGILECTPGAHTSEWFQNKLQEFTSQTGYVLNQRVLELHECWPARRSRWWGTLTKPELKAQEIPPMPKLEFGPTFFHLFPKLKTLDEQEIKELSLDLYELSNFFNHPKGIKSNIVDYYKPLPTATHSWGSQLTACACGCRSTGFSPDRLQTKGLYGQLIPMPGRLGSDTYNFPNLRHMHAKEVALANGLIPSYVPQGEGNQRLLLSAVGQLASPLQSLWVYSNLMDNCGKHLHVETESPLIIMERYVQTLFVERDELLGITPDEHTRYMSLFQQAWKKMVNPIADPTTHAAVVASASEHPSVQPISLGDNITGPITNEDNAHKKGKGVGGSNQNPETSEHGVDIDETLLLSKVKKCEDNIKRVNQTEVFQRGGVPGFAAIANPIEMHPNSKQEHQDPPQENQESQDASVHETVKSEVPTEKPSTHHIDLVVPNAKRLRVQVQQTSRVYDIVKAEEAICTMKQPITAADVMGKILHPQTVLEDSQTVVLHPGGLSPSRCPKEAHGPRPILSGETRETILWKQEGWVAVDEMNFYHNMLHTMHPHRIQQCVVLPDNPSKLTVFGQSIVQLVKAFETQKAAVVTSVLADQHWTPISVSVQDGTITVKTSPMQVYWVQSMIHESLGSKDFVVEAKAIAQEFHADCGFQVIGWCLSELQDTDQITPVTTEQAITWRNQFAQYLIQSDKSQTMVKQPLILGGMHNGTQVREQLQQLVKQHGVTPERSQACAEELIAALGTTTLGTILKSPKPWTDLKARANLHQPPIRIVLAAELKEVIQQKVAAGPIGNKHGKAKKQQDFDVLKLRSHQITIPYAVFKQEDGKEVGQIQAAQIMSTSRGVVIMNVEEAIPYFQLNQPVSGEGIALLIIDHDDPRVPTSKQLLRVPAQCASTGEPIILTVAMIQVGSQAIARNLPQQCVEIEEVANKVVRIAVYRDQFPGDWTEFASKPVKMLVEQAPFQHMPPQSILDVWDRQFVNHRMQRTQPGDAQIFMVNLRIVTDQVEPIMSINGSEGKFAEPRSSNGRQPDSNYQVVWLPRKSFQEAQLAKQVAKTPVVLVRSGDKYGLRVHNTAAEQVHREHRPDVLYLEGNEVKKYKVGPLPYGSTKQSIVNAFKKWGWVARPIGPQGQSSDRSGTMWMVQATNDPSHWIFQMHHGDVLITQESADISTRVEAAPGVVASAKTLQTLKGETKTATIKPDSAKELSVGQVVSIQAQLEASIDRKIREAVPTTGDDDMHDTKDRIDQLESQMQQLTGSMQVFQQQQQQNTQALYTQVQAMDTKINEQDTKLNRMLDNKLDAQMQKIEALLTKRSRTE